MPWKNWSIRNKITVAFIILIVAPIVFLCLYSYNQAQSKLRQQLVSNANTSLDQVVYSIQNKMDIAESISNNIVFNSRLQYFLSSTFKPDTSLDEYMDYIVPMVKYAIQYQMVNIDNISLYMNNESIPEGFSSFHHESSIATQSWYQSFIKSNRRSQWVRIPAGAFTTFAYVQKIEAYNGQYLGFTKIDLLQKDLLFPVSPSPSSTSTAFLTNELFAIDSDGNVLLQRSEENWPPQLGNAKSLNSEHSYKTIEKRLYIAKSIHKLNISLAMGIPLSLRSTLLQILTTFIFLAAILALMVSFYGVIKIVFFMMKRSIDQMDKVIDAGFNDRMPIDRKDEFGVIAVKFNTLLDKINTLMNDSIRKETAHKDSQLKLLQLQINPHFVYNTIEIFGAKMELAGMYDISEAFTDFGRMLRYNTETKGMFSTVGLEIKYLKSYISLQKIRYGAKIELIVQASEELLPTKVIKFILQPIVENSIKYGMMPGSILLINLTVSLLGKHLQMVILDNGEGMSSNQVQALNDRFAQRFEDETESDKNSGSIGIGLGNINERLRLFYGDSYGIIVESLQGHFTRVSFIIPLEN